MAQVAEHVHAVDPCRGDRWHLVEDSYPDLERNIRRYEMQDKITVHRGKSEHVIPVLRDGVFDLAFIDGDHSQEGVEIDTSIERCVKAGGYMVFHDFGAGLFGVDHAVETWAGQRMLETVGSLGIVKVDG